VKRTVSRCTTSLVSGPVKFKATTASATLSRGATVAARGTAARYGKRVTLVLAAATHLARGRYTLTLTTRDARGGVHRTSQVVTV
jgi:hypothetical protein